MRDSVLSSFLQAGPPAARWTGTGLAMVGSAVWSSLTGTLAAILAGMFVADMVLGVLRAVHVGGIEAFDWQRFMRGGIKFAAAIVGIALATLGDLLLHQSGLPDGLSLLTSAVLFSTSWGFFWSASTSFAYFFPDVAKAVGEVLAKTRKEQPGRVPEAPVTYSSASHPGRRKSDRRAP